MPHALGAPGFILGAVIEVAIPVWAERARATTWHPSHIVERYGLFTIIVLGESILASSLAIQAATDASGLTASVTMIIVGGLLTVFSMWWFYFDWPVAYLERSSRRAFAWGYVHYFVFAAAAAVGAGLAVAVDRATHQTAVGEIEAGAAVAVPVAIYLVVLWALHGGPRQRAAFTRYSVPAVAACILVTPFIGQAVLLMGVLSAGLLATKLTARHHPRLQHLVEA